MIELTLKPKGGYPRFNFEKDGSPAPYDHAAEIGDVVVLQTLSFKLRARVEQVDGSRYVGRIMDCPVDEYLGEEIGFGEAHIHTKMRPATS